MIRTGGKRRFILSYMSLKKELTDSVRTCYLCLCIEDSLEFHTDNLNITDT